MSTDERTELRTLLARIGSFLEEVIVATSAASAAVAASSGVEPGWGRLLQSTSRAASSAYARGYHAFYPTWTQKRANLAFLLQQVRKPSATPSDSGYRGLLIVVLKLLTSQYELSRLFFPLYTGSDVTVGGAAGARDAWGVWCRDVLQDDRSQSHQNLLKVGNNYYVCGGILGSGAKPLVRLTKSDGKFSVDLSLANMPSGNPSASAELQSHSAELHLTHCYFSCLSLQPPSGLWRWCTTTACMCTVAKAAL